MRALDPRGVAVVDPPTPLYRVGRDTAPVAFSYIAPEIDARDDLGYRFDVLGAGVMYAATTDQGAYTETVQKFRVNAETAAAAKRTQPDLMTAGSLPADWREHRRLHSFTIRNGLPFVDVDDTRSHTALTHHLAGDLAALGYSNLDVSVVRSEHRLLTRLIATWVYLQEDSSGTPAYSGIRFVSKLGDHECWALFEGVPVADIQSTLIPLPDLRQACDSLGIWAH